MARTTELAALGEPLDASATKQDGSLHRSSREIRREVQRLSCSQQPEPAIRPNIRRPSTDRRSSQLHVNWSTIDGACAEVLSFAAEPDIGVPLSYTPVSSGVCSELCRDCHRFFFGKDTPGRGGLDGFARSRPLKDGLCWKLNSGLEHGSKDELAKMSNWRRRRFFMQRNEGKLGLLYISEKEDGMMQLGCILHDAEEPSKKAEINQLASITMTLLGAEESREIGRNLHEYDLAFSVREKYHTDHEYESEIPKTLYPVTINWQDHAKTSQFLVLGFDTHKDRHVWLHAMQISIQTAGL